MLILGIDDAGRGPIIGPMILSGLLVNKQQEKFLKEHGVRDSKALLPSTREKLRKLVESHSIQSEVIKTSAEEIDSSLNSGTNLNTLEAIKTAEIINKITSKHKNEKIKVVIDCPSVNISAWKNTLISYIKNPENLEVLCEHKADANHPAVAAASILAKETREEEVKKIKKKYGDIGSGYPSDPTTQVFLKTQGSKLKDSGIFRKTWATWKNLFPQKDQATLGDF